MAIKSPKYYVYKGKELEQNYFQNLFWALLVAGGLVGLLFAGVKKIEVGVYKPSQTPKPVTVAFVPTIQRMEEPPPPVKPKLDIKIVEVKERNITSIRGETKEVREEKVVTQEAVPTQQQTEINPIENIPLPTLSTTDEIYEFFKVEIKPQVIKSVQPEYPELARRGGIEGRVLVNAVVDENGNVISAEIVSSTNPIFNESALKAAYQYKFSPAMMKDKKVKVKVLIPFNFVLRK